MTVSENIPSDPVTGTEHSLVARLRGIVAFLPTFQAPEFRFGAWERPPPEGGFAVFPYFAHSPEAAAFLKAVYSYEWIQEFDWPSWLKTREARRLRDDPNALARATLDQLTRLLTAVVRQDRFVEGALGNSFETGLIIRILRPAQALLIEAEASETPS